MFVKYTYERRSGSSEIRKYRSMSVGVRLTTRICVKVSQYAGHRSGLYLIDRRGRVREAQ